ncbi:MAG: hypothetical protein RIR12_2218 [Bacteroidota bacterium]|jgi:hypothetical protein
MFAMQKRPMVITLPGRKRRVPLQRFLQNIYAAGGDSSGKENDESLFKDFYNIFMLQEETRLGKETQC